MQKIQFQEQSRTDRKLPHLETGGRAYFITVRAVRKLVPRERDAIVSCIESGADRGIFLLYLGVVMPDHFHVIIRPQPVHDGTYRSILSICDAWKRLVARELGVQRLFQRDQFDRLIRADEWDDTVEYLLSNPVRAGICERHDQYPWVFPRRPI